MLLRTALVSILAVHGADLLLSLYVLYLIGNRELWLSSVITLVCLTRFATGSLSLLLNLPSNSEQNLKDGILYYESATLGLDFQGNHQTSKDNLYASVHLFSLSARIIVGMATGLGYIPLRFLFKPYSFGSELNKSQPTSPWRFFWNI